MSEGNHNHDPIRDDEFEGIQPSLETIVLEKFDPRDRHVLQKFSVLDQRVQLLNRRIGTTRVEVRDLQSEVVALKVEIAVLQKLRDKLTSFWGFLLILAAVITAIIKIVEVIIKMVR